MRVGRCVAVLGGSFDPPHNGHLALARYFVTLLTPDELRVLPAGRPWQKQDLQTAADHRISMARLAFEKLAAPVVVDPQEILRTGPTYTIDTLRSLRGELGPDASIAFLIGADQLQKLHTWKDWRQLFDHAHICAASRPGFAFDAAHLDQEVARECARRAASPQQIRTSAAGLMFLADGLHVDLSATAVRQACARREDVKTMLPPAVLDYVTTHHLYKT